MIPPSLSIQTATLKFQNTSLFENLHFDIPCHQWTAILGQSGIGKSSLLRLLAGLTFNSGTLVSDDIPAVSYMSQEDSLLPWLTVWENIFFGYRLRRQSISLDFKNYAKHLLTKVNLLAAKDLLPHKLSGGMRQRVALVRTLLEDAPLVLMDEPFAALDMISRLTLQSLAFELLQHKTVLFVTHDPLEALRLAHKIYIMAGKPCRIYVPIELTTPPPRQLRESVVLNLQVQLLEELQRVFIGEQCID